MSVLLYEEIILFCSCGNWFSDFYFKNAINELFISFIGQII
jgi:hypothetical protein